ncbi:MAG: Hsp20/alpha crystallin family protein [Bacteroidota bacterium]
MCYSRANRSHWGKHHHHPRHHAKRWWKHKMAQAWGYPPVNVEELDDRYEILVYAAGYGKSDFGISLKDNTLVVQAEKPATTEEATEQNWRRREFRPGGFERYFELNEKINKEAITAQYADGVLKVTLPKLEGKETFRQEIEVV